MASDRNWTGSATIALMYGVTLTGATAGWHPGIEAGEPGRLTEPASGFLLDRGLALLIVFTAVRLADSDLAEPADGRCLRVRRQRRVLAIGVTVAIRALEGRVTTEVPFVVFTTLGAGFLAGATAGWFRAAADRRSRRLRRTRDAVTFVNETVCHDVRNDANVIAGCAQQLDDGSEADTVSRERAETVIERTEQARAVTETVIGRPIRTRRTPRR